MEPRGLGQSHAESEATGADWMKSPTTEQAVEELTYREVILPPALRELRQKLGQKAKQQKRFRFYSLYAHICRTDTLQAAWEAVRRNGGAPHRFIGVTSRHLTNAFKNLSMVVAACREMIPAPGISMRSGEP